ncbi:dTDP-4-amino-4,6-dideoxygalactose transaminase [Halarcobacter mediterraneus]|uniref:dTDP-4-amino-4,6-dideoxygalactose transaminase n=1 Tax=Halarcobacter mediterraneus TaxID=2023153 RepID=A0A4Q1AYV5_9BACT|nr:dTDP-4-amino-4,6-dideoxygalactose transaminase [Halarcobacter mediterraneus]RXK13600.1 dTDP-4-amino-4,6-dideoxygalactose transaminase [Halarcobacter mediterraneus]
MLINFNKPTIIGTEQKYILTSMQKNKISGDGYFTKLCQNWFNKKLNAKLTLLTPSCTHSLEMAALLLDIKKGDEIIMPSYTFVSTANAFALRGAKIIFIDINADTMNIDESRIEDAITQKTKAIVVVHYAGVSCEMDTIMEIANKYNIFVVEDSAQAIMSKYKDTYLGTIGHIGTYSFHETKNLTSAGEGGLLIINDNRFKKRAEIIREKGTNRSQFFRGEIDKYTWVDIGSSYLLNDISAAFLWGQIQNAKLITKNRLNTWSIYYKNLKILEKQGYLKLPFIPKECIHNAHMFYIKLKDEKTRFNLIKFLRKNGIESCFHYIPLHTSTAGKKYSKFVGEDIHTTKESKKILRLPLYFELSERDTMYIIERIKTFFKTYDENKIFVNT